MDEQTKQAINELAHYNIRPIIEGDALLLDEDSAPDDYEPSKELVSYLIKNKRSIVSALENQAKADKVLAAVAKAIAELDNLEVMIQGAEVTNVQTSGRFFAKSKGAVFSCVASKSYWEIIKVGQVLDIIGTWGRPWASDNISIICSDYIVIRGENEVPF